MDYKEETRDDNLATYKQKWAWDKTDSIYYNAGPALGEITTLFRNTKGRQPWSEWEREVFEESGYERKVCLKIAQRVDSNTQKLEVYHQVALAETIPLKEAQKSEKDIASMLEA